jgi:hypothetical protein
MFKNAGNTRGTVTGNYAENAQRHCQRASKGKVARQIKPGENKFK